MTPLRVGGACVTPDGYGTVCAIVNATRWKQAWVTVELAGGRRRAYLSSDVEAAA